MGNTEARENREEGQDGMDGMDGLDGMDGMDGMDGRDGMDGYGMVRAAARPRRTPKAVDIEIVFTFYHNDGSENKINLHVHAEGNNREISKEDLPRVYRKFEDEFKVDAVRNLRQFHIDVSRTVGGEKSPVTEENPFVYDPKNANKFVNRLMYLLHETRPCKREDSHKVFLNVNFPIHERLRYHFTGSLIEISSVACFKWSMPTSSGDTGRFISDRIEELY